MALVYMSAKDAMMTGNMDVTAGDMTAYLVSSSYSASESHSRLSEVPSGARLASTEVTGRSVSNGTLTANPAVFSEASGGTAVGIVLAIGDDLVGFQDDYGNGPGGTALPLNGSQVTANWSPAGVLTLNA